MRPRHTRAQLAIRPWPACALGPAVALVLAGSIAGCWTSHDFRPATCSAATCETECCAFDFRTGEEVEAFCLAPMMTCRERPPAYDASPWWSSDALLAPPDASPLPPSDAGPPTPPDAGPPDPLDAGIDCSVEPSPARACVDTSECTMLFHYADCCGTGVWSGMRLEAAEGFATHVAACDPLLPACGCAARPTLADDGTDESQPGASLHVACTAGLCTTSYARSR